MDFKYKQLEQELSALSKVFSELGVRLSEVAKEVTATGVNPSEKLIEQISASRASFENVRSAVHGHATVMLVSPLPKLGELVSIATIESLFKAAVAAEDTKVSIEAEREKALAILGRVLTITHRDSADFKPLQECHSKIGELRNAVLNVVWPHRHPESEGIVEHKHPTTDLLHFVEHLDQIDDERWMTLETTISDTYGKPLFVAASRGKLAVVAAHKPDAPGAVRKPAVTVPAAAPEAAKPDVAAEKPVEKKIVVEKAPEKPAPVPTVSGAPPAVSTEKKPLATAPAAAVADKAPQKPVAPQPPTPLVNSSPVVPIQTTPVASPEKKPVPAPAPAHPAAAASTPLVPQAAATASTVAVTRPPAAAPPAAVVTVPPAPPAHSPAMPPPASTVSTQVPAVPVAAAPNATPQASPLTVNVNSLAALATATEPAEKKPAPAPADALDKQRKEPRLATPAPQSVSKPESRSQDGPEAGQRDAMQESLGDGSQRPQRWGFWRGNR